MFDGLFVEEDVSFTFSRVETWNGIDNLYSGVGNKVIPVAQRNFGTLYDVVVNEEIEFDDRKISEMLLKIERENVVFNNVIFTDISETDIGYKIKFEYRGKSYNDI